MINNRRDLIANKNINKYSTAVLGMLEPHDWLLSRMAEKWVELEAFFSSGNSEQPNMSSLVIAEPG